MRIFVIALTLLFGLLQYTLWFGKNGVSDYLDVGALPEGPLAWQQARLAVFEVAQAGQAQALMQRGIELVETFDIGEMRYALTCEQEARDAH